MQQKNNFICFQEICDFFENELMCDLEKNYYFSVDANKDDREFLQCILKFLSVLSQKTI
jgi:hypothetical protein